MAAINAIYQKRSTNVASAMTWTIETGTAPSSQYGPSALTDENPAKVAKIEDTTGAWLGTAAGAQRVDMIALIHHDFAAGADVKIQANTSDSWGSPAFEASITIPAWEGADDTLWPVNPWLDLRPLTGYSATGWQYWRLVVTSNSQNLQLGQILMYAEVPTFTRNFGLVHTHGRSKPIVENVTSHGVSAIVSRGTTRWRMSFQFAAMTDAQRASLKAHWEDVDGRVYPWLFVPDGLVNAAYYVRWASTEEQFQRVLPSYSSASLAVEEVARGLRPGV